MQSACGELNIALGTHFELSPLSVLAASPVLRASCTGRQDAARRSSSRIRRGLSANSTSRHRARRSTSRDGTGCDVSLDTPTSNAAQPASTARQTSRSKNDCTHRIERGFVPGGCSARPRPSCSASRSEVARVSRTAQREASQLEFSQHPASGQARLAILLGAPARRCVLPGNCASRPRARKEVPLTAALAPDRTTNRCKQWNGEFLSAGSCGLACPLDTRRTYS